MGSKLNEWNPANRATEPLKSNGAVVCKNLGIIPLSCDKSSGMPNPLMTSLSLKILAFMAESAACLNLWPDIVPGSVPLGDWAAACDKMGGLEMFQPVPSQLKITS